jgi:hypothetical protein
VFFISIRKEGKKNYQNFITNLEKQEVKETPESKEIIQPEIEQKKTIFLDSKFWLSPIF